jgi:hypothetical protein
MPTTISPSVTFLGFFGDFTPKKWPLQGSRSQESRNFRRLMPLNPGVPSAYARIYGGWAEHALSGPSQWQL